MSAQRRLGPWKLAWVAWLVAFLVVEVPAALRKSKLDTFSENVWEWFGVSRPMPYRLARRIILAIFLLTLASHFVFGWPGGASIVITGLPVGMVILYSLVRE